MASAWRDQGRLISDQAAIRAAYRAWMQPDGPGRLALRGRG